MLLSHTPSTLFFYFFYFFLILDIRTHSFASISGFQGELVTCIWHFLDPDILLNSPAHCRGQPIPLFAVFREFGLQINQY